MSRKSLYIVEVDMKVVPKEGYSFGAWLGTHRAKRLKRGLKLHGEVKGTTRHTQLVTVTYKARGASKHDVMRTYSAGEWTRIADVEVIDTRRRKIAD